MSERSTLRLLILGVLVLSLLGTLVFRLFYLQLLSGESYRVAAKSNSAREVVNPAVRGLILREHATLVLLGLGLGCLAAAFAVGPLLVGGGTALPWRTLVPTLAAVAINGLIFTWLATRYACRGIVVDALRGE